MTTVIFVHGIGGREPLYSETLSKIERSLHRTRPDVSVMPCSWGETLGARLNDNGASIPLYDTTRSIAASIEDDEYEIALWEQLYRDPLYELRLLSLQSDQETDYVPGQLLPGDELDERLQTLIPSASLQAKLEDAGITEIFDEARLVIINSAPYDEVLQTVSYSLAGYTTTIARSLIATAISLCEQHGKYAAILTDARLRDSTIELLARALGDSERAIPNWILKPLAGLAMPYVQRRRGALTSAISPLAGDILLYQGHGTSIRAFIRAAIQQAKPPVVLLAHSLGGIACVDVLAQESLSAVQILITVGSQAPFLYEIDALHGLRYQPQSEQRLPTYFPAWLNIYDLRDILSYIGARVFPNQVQDVLVDNKQPFPQAHSAYWDNPATWNIILPRLP